MSRRRVIENRSETPVPVYPYIDVVPERVWITDTTDNYMVVFSNTGWILE